MRKLIHLFKIKLASGIILPAFIITDLDVDDLEAASIVFSQLEEQGYIPEETIGYRVHIIEI